MKDNNEKKEKKNKKDKKKIMTPQLYTFITIVFVGAIVFVGIYSNIANWSKQNESKIQVTHSYEQEVDTPENAKVLGKPNKFNNIYVVDMFNNQIWLNNVLLIIALTFCFIVLPIASNIVGTKLRNKSRIIKLVYLILTSAINCIFYFWIPVAIMMIFINFISYKRGLLSIESKEKKREFNNKK